MRLERLEDFTLAFHRMSGETHVLSHESEAIYDACTDLFSDAPLTASLLWPALRRRFDEIDTGDADPVTVIAHRLDELHRLGFLHLVQ